MSDCIFCKIAAGEIPADKVYETDRVLAFNDLNPQAPRHVLVIPKEHVTSLDTATDGKLLGELMMASAEIARREGLADAGYRVVLNVNQDGGQSVAHLHAHVLGGRQMTWPPG